MPLCGFRVIVELRSWFSRDSLTCCLSQGTFRCRIAGSLRTVQTPTPVTIWAGLRFTGYGQLVMAQSSLEIARLLMNFGADVSVTDDKGWTPLLAELLLGSSAKSRYCIRDKK
jgi:hypothetical protein